MTYISLRTFGTKLIKVHKQNPWDPVSKPWTAANMTWYSMKPNQNECAHEEGNTHLFPIEVGVPPEGTPGASEREHRQRDRDGNIHSNLQRQTAPFNTHSIVLIHRITEPAGVCQYGFTFGVCEEEGC